MRTILALLLILLPAVALADGPQLDGPRWSLEVKGGAFFPDAEKWSRFYGSGYLGEYGLAVAYKVTRQLEVGIEGSYSRAKGKGVQPLHGQEAQEPTGEATFQRVPVNLFLLGRGIFNEKQWIVPYAGGGYTRLFYRAGIKGQGRTQGSVNGFHARGGIELLLDRAEPRAASNLREEFGLDHTYFFVEGKYTRAMADTVTGPAVNLGGAGCLAGFLFEF